MKKVKGIIFIGVIIAVIISLISIIYFKDLNKIDIFSGHEYGIHKSIGFSNIYRFNKDSGKKIDYEVENIGEGDIVIKINKDEEKNIKANEKQTISYKLEKDNEILNFKAYSNNDRVNIKYDIRQN